MVRKPRQRRNSARLPRYLKLGDSRPDAPRLIVESKPNQPLAISQPSSADSAGLALAFGTTEGGVASILLNSLINAACDGTPGHPPSAQDINGVLAAVHGIGANDEIEAMLAVQMVATHFAATRALRRLKASDTVPQQDSNGNLAVKLLRTFAAQEELLRHRGKGQHTVEAFFVARKRLNREESEKATYHVEFDISESGLDYEPGDSFGVFPANDEGLVEQVIAAIGAPHDFPVAGKTLRQVLREDVSLGLAPDKMFELISYITGGVARAKAKALAKGEDPDGDAATVDVLAAIEKFPRVRPDSEAFVEALEPLQPRLYSIASSLKAGPGRVSLTIDHLRYISSGGFR
jgi:sulfite reductase alpha subunit-like flavoprotein